MSEYTTTFFSSVAIGGLKTALLATPAYVFGSNGVRLSIPGDHVTENSQQQQNEIVRQVIFGKKITSSNLYDMVTRHNWTLGAVYVAYDSRLSDMSELPFFVIASNRAVYKCLSNNNGAPSTIQPTTLSPTPVVLADGYQWKYMFRLSVNDLTNLATPTLIPVIADANTAAAAVLGSIDVVSVQSSGAGYTGISSGIVRQVLSNIQLMVPTDNIPYDGALVGSAILITSGPGAGQIGSITNYNSNSTGRYVHIDTPLTGVSITSQYRIAPNIIINGDGAGAKAIALVSNSMITGVEVISKGSGYTWATGAVVANSAYGTGGQVFPIIPPAGGHGSDPTRELFSRELLVHMDVVGNEAGSIPTTFSYGTYGVLIGAKQASNTAVTYSANTFNNTVALDTVQVGGQIARGEQITSDDINKAEMTVIYAASGNLVAVYDTKSRAELFDTFVSTSGITGVISSITQPNVYCHDSKLLCFEDINTINHSSTTETINIILRY
jgi:hypothetical protein